MNATEEQIAEWQFGKGRAWKCQELRNEAARNPDHWLNSTPDLIDADATPLYRGIKVTPDFELLRAQPGMSYKFGPSAFSRNIHLACTLSNYQKPSGWISVIMCLHGKFQAIDIQRHLSKRDVLKEVIVAGQFLINAIRTTENDVVGTVLWLGMEPMPTKRQN